MKALSIDIFILLKITRKINDFKEVSCLEYYLCLNFLINNLMLCCAQENLNLISNRFIYLYYLFYHKIDPINNYLNIYTGLKGGTNYENYYVLPDIIYPPPCELLTL